MGSYDGIGGWKDHGLICGSGREGELGLVGGMGEIIIIVHILIAAAIISYLVSY